MTEVEKWNSVKNCDSSYDGKFYYGVKTTGIYCRPSCKSKLPKRENIVFFDTREEAEKAGFRACKRCRPDLVDYDPAKELSERAKKLLESHFNDRVELSQEMKEMGVTRKHLTEVFKQQYDITPSEYLIQVRISASKKMLQEGYSIQDASLLAGYDNLSAFYDHFHRETGMTPSRYRQLFANNISRDILDTPIGKLSIYASKEGILCVEKNVPSSTNFDKEIKDDASGELVKTCEKELSEYFSGKRKSFDLPLLPEGSDFQKKVWEKLLKIPYGETRTYGELAEMTGDKKASRAVGMANHNNPILILIPCHRVIGSDGSLTGYAAGVEAKKYLLQLEKENQK